MKKILGLCFIAVNSLSSYASAQTMDLAEFSRRAEIDNSIAGRCVSGGATVSQCSRTIEWARNNSIITARAADWADKNYFYPIVDFFDGRVAAVCKCSAED